MITKLNQIFASNYLVFGGSVSVKQTLTQHLFSLLLPLTRSTTHGKDDQFTSEDTNKQTESDIFNQELKILDSEIFSYKNKTYIQHPSTNSRYQLSSSAPAMSFKTRNNSQTESDRLIRLFHLRHHRAPPSKRTKIQI